MASKLSPLKKRTKQLKQKQNSWVLDCINEEKSKLKPYSAMKDRYLKYFVVRVPKKKRNYSKFMPEPKPVDSNNFKDFLNLQKQKVLQGQNHINKRTLTERSMNQKQQSGLIARSSDQMNLIQHNGKQSDNNKNESIKKQQHKINEKNQESEKREILRQNKEQENKQNKIKINEANQIQKSQNVIIQKIKLKNDKNKQEQKDKEKKMSQSSQREKKQQKKVIKQGKITRDDKNENGEAENRPKGIKSIKSSDKHKQNQILDQIQINE